MKTIKLFIIIVLAVMSLSLASAQEDSDGDSLPPPTGPYQVGVTMRQYQDEARDKLVTIWFWYPAEVDEETDPAPYLLDDVARGGIRGFLTGLRWARDIDMTMEQLEDFNLYAFQDAPLYADEAPYPVIVSANVGFPNLQAQQLQELASHGYIVADAHIAYETEVNPVDTGDIPELAADVMFTLDQLEAMNAGEIEDIFTGYLDLDNVGASGVSAIGGGVYKAAMEYSRITAGISEDGVYSATESISQPWMFFQVQFAQSPYRTVDGPGYLLRPSGFVHMTFTDFTVLPGAVESGQVKGDMTPLRAQEIINAYIVAFFDEYLKGIEQPLLDGPSDDFPEVTIESRNTG